MNMPLQQQSLETLNFDNRFVENLPADPERKNFRRQVSGACYSRVNPTRVAKPRLAGYSREVAEILDLSTAECNRPLFTEIFAGNRLLDTMDPFAMCYGGHQFGTWAGQLGDGRAINLGEVVNHRGERWTLQLKGAGLTPYSRSADGLAVLRSSIREFLCSEAMFHLGIPTTRALSLITTGESVLRDILYDGHPRYEPGAVVCRVSPSFLRFGNFEILTARGETALLRKLVDYTIQTDFPHLGAPSVPTYIQWFREICQTTAIMIIHWMRVGFVHGVMNTDNMSILGLTIDYGPYGWLEGFDANWTPNITDAHGRRYRFSNQPHIGQWNLLQLANAIYPLVQRAEPFQEALGHYNDTFENGWNDTMAEKLGFSSFDADTDDALIGELLELLQLTETDMTIFFRNLATVSTRQEANSQEGEIPAALIDAYYNPEDLSKEFKNRLGRWVTRYRLRLESDTCSEKERRQRMNRVNPKYVLRNYLAQQAIDKAENGDFSMVEELLDLVRKPYDDQPDRQHFAMKRPEWARNKPGCSMLSCSS
ncbi:MAG: protein adenylyltransferase SelO [Desulforhopalus sp.]